jgi:hypothetical protein
VTLISKFFRLPLFVQFWIVPVWILLGMARAAINLFSFKKLVPLLGTHGDLAFSVPLVDPAQEARARQIGGVILAASKRTPWTSNCFPQAMVARLLLGLYKIPYALFFGVLRNHELDSLEAHAWVATGSVRVTGGYSFGRYTVVGHFYSHS